MNGVQMWQQYCISPRREEDGDAGIFMTLPSCTFTLETFAEFVVFDMYYFKVSTEDLFAWCKVKRKNKYQMVLWQLCEYFAWLSHCYKHFHQSSWNMILYVNVLRNFLEVQDPALFIVYVRLSCYGRWEQNRALLYWSSRHKCFWERMIMLLGTVWLGSRGWQRGVEEVR